MLKIISKNFDIKVNRWMIYLSVILIILVLIDSLSTRWAVNNGFAELNTFIAPYAASWLFAALKILTIFLLIAGANWFAQKLKMPIINKLFIGGLFVMIGTYTTVNIINLTQLV